MEQLAYNTQLIGQSSGYFYLDCMRVQAEQRKYWMFRRRHWFLIYLWCREFTYYGM